MSPKRLMETRFHSVLDAPTYIVRELARARITYPLRHFEERRREHGHVLHASTESRAEKPTSSSALSAWHRSSKAGTWADWGKAVLGGSSARRSMHLRELLSCSPANLSSGSGDNQESLISERCGTSELLGRRQRQATSSL